MTNLPLVHQYQTLPAHQAIQGLQHFPLMIMQKDVTVITRAGIKLYFNNEKGTYSWSK